MILYFNSEDISMKKNENILKRVEQYKYKRGIYIADTGSSLYKVLRILATLSFIYFMMFNMLYILAELMMIGLGQVNFSDVKDAFIPVAVCTALIIAGYVLNCTRLKLSGCFVSLLPLIFNIIVFYRTVSNASGSGEVVDTTSYILGMPPYFYYRHLIPTVLLFIFMVIMIIVDIRARIKNNKLYDHIMDNLYVQYRSGDKSDMSEAEWQEFLNTYDPSGYKKQFTENTEAAPTEESSADEDATETEE